MKGAPNHRPQREKSLRSSAGIDKAAGEPHFSDEHETESPTADPGTSMARTANAGLEADASAFLCRGQAADAGLSGGPAEIDRQAGRLVVWARQSGLILPDTFLTGCDKHPGDTAEHEVFHRPGDNRALKRTYPGTFGVTADAKGNHTAATPLFYLHRLQLMNHVFDSDMRLEGIALGHSPLIGQRGKQPSIVISQPWIRAADLANPHPSEAEIAQFMRKLGFEPLTSVCFGWHRAADGMTVVDARPDNFIMSAEGVVPVDLVVTDK